MLTLKAAWLVEQDAPDARIAVSRAKLHSTEMAGRAADTTLQMPFGGRIVSPVYLASFDAQMFYGYFAYPADGSLFAKQEFEYIKPLLVGVPYTMTGKLVEIYKRKGRSFYRLGISVTDDVGEEHMRMVKTIAAPVKPVPEGADA